MLRQVAGSTGKHAARSVASTGLAQAWRVLLGLTSGVLLARLLQPADFGLMAMAMTGMSLAVLVQDLGLGQATVQREQLDPAHVSAMFWLTLAVSAGVALAMVLAGPAIAAFYRQPRVVPLVTGFAAVLVLYGAQGQPMALLQRQMRFHGLAVIDVVAATAGFAAALAVAIIWRSYWALFASTLVSAVVSLIGAWRLARWRPGRPAFRGEFAALLRFGGGVSGFQVLNFVTRNADNILIGRVLGQVTLGFYDRAYRLLLFPLQQITLPLQKVMVPLLSRLQGEPKRYRDAYGDCVSLVMALVQPGVLVIVLHAQGVFDLVLGERWRPAAPIFQWLGVAGLEQPLVTTFSWLLISQGRGGDFLKLGLISAVSALVAFTVGLTWGAVGVAAAYAISEYLRLPVSVWWVGRSGPVSARDLWTMAWPHVVATAAAGVALLGLRMLGAPFTWSYAAAAVAVSYLTYAVALWAFPAKRRLAQRTVNRTAVAFGRPVQEAPGAYGG